MKSMGKKAATTISKPNTTTTTTGRSTANIVNKERIGRIGAQSAKLRSSSSGGDTSSLGGRNISSPASQNVGTGTPVTPAPRPSTAVPVPQRQPQPQATSLVASLQALAETPLPVSPVGVGGGINGSGLTTPIPAEVLPVTRYPLPPPPKPPTFRPIQPATATAEQRSTSPQWSDSGSEIDQQQQQQQQQRQSRQTTATEQPPQRSQPLIAAPVTSTLHHNPAHHHPLNLTIDVPPSSASIIRPSLSSQPVSGTVASLSALLASAELESTDALLYSLRASTPTPPPPPPPMTQSAVPDTAAIPLFSSSLPSRPTTTSVPISTATKMGSTIPLASSTPAASSSRPLGTASASSSSAPIASYASITTTSSTNRMEQRRILETKAMVLDGFRRGLDSKSMELRDRKSVLDHDQTAAMSQLQTSLVKYSEKMTLAIDQRLHKIDHEKDKLEGLAQQLIGYLQDSHRAFSVDEWSHIGNILPLPQAEIGIHH
jgi:hypothetical protein